MQPDLLDPVHSAHALQQLRTLSPLVHCMTNDVVQTFTANVLLSLGASPAMVIDREEAQQFSAIADALLINVGTLTRERAEAMHAAIESANRAQTPWTLDRLPLAHSPFAPVSANNSSLFDRPPSAATLLKSSPWPVCQAAGAASTPPIARWRRCPRRSSWLNRPARWSQSLGRLITSPMVYKPSASAAAIR